jgi:hypothetical protein
VRRLLLFAPVLAVFGVRHLPGISDQAAEWISLATPFALVAAGVAWHGGVPEFSDLGWI